MKNLTFIFFVTFSIQLYSQEIPEGFVDIRDVIPDIILELRYLTNHNFLGVPVDGYISEKCYITKPAADSLAKVQAELKKFNLSLKIYDAYRPQQAVDHFVKWA
jgi:D-alanyl-D-alanine dipeptidase